MTHHLTLHEETLYTRTRPVPGGHLIWTGPYNGDTPVLNLRGHQYPARDLLLQAHLHRPPTGDVTSACDDTRCVAPAHLLDEIGRRNNAAVEPTLALLARTAVVPLGTPTQSKATTPRQRLLEEELPTGAVYDRKAA